MHRDYTLRGLSREGKVRGSRRRDRAPRPADWLKFEPVAKGRLATGVVVWAYVPFEEGHDWKSRPAVIEKVTGRCVTILPGTSSDSRWRFPRLYAEVEDLEAAGLHRATAIKCAEISVDFADIIEIVGRLSDRDMRVLAARVPNCIPFLHDSGLAS